MRTRKASELIDDLRKLTDTEYATDRFPNAEMLEYLNQSIVRLCTLLDRLDASFYITHNTFPTESGITEYGLPTDFWALKACKVILSSTTSINVRRYMPSEAAGIENTTNYSVYGSYPMFYSVHGDKLKLLPTPQGQYTIRIEYSQLPQRMSLTPDSEFDGIAGFERWVVLDAGVKVKTKDSLDPGQILQEKADVESWIVSMATSRDAANPERVQDVQSDDVSRIFSDRW